MPRRQRPDGAATARSTGRRALARVAVICATACVAEFGPLGLGPASGPNAATAQAATSYRYWTYWKSPHGNWQYATVGPASVPPDGSVEGWRFEVSTEGGARPPRRAPDFAAICHGTGASPGHKRVGVVVDYGTPNAAPSGETPPGGVRTFCADVPAGASGYAVLNAHASFRSATSGLVCALDGYPASGCADAAGGTGSPAANAPTASARADQTRGDPAAQPGARVPYAAIAGVVAAVALGGAAVRRARRRS